MSDELDQRLNPPPMDTQVLLICDKNRIKELEKQLAEREAALARCVEFIHQFRTRQFRLREDAAETIDSFVASLPTSAQATAKVLVAARRVAYVTTTKVDDPQGQADAMHDALTELVEAIREEQETK